MLTQFTAKLTAKTKLSDKLYCFSFLINGGEKISFAAGQYVLLKTKDKNNQPITRLYSIASKDGLIKGFDLLIEPVVGGVATKYFEKLKIEDTSLFQGPAGAFTFKKTGRPAVFLATGSGIAPIKSMVLSNLPSEKNPIYLFWGIQNKSQICLLRELKWLAEKHHNFSFFYCLSREKGLSFSQLENRKYFFLGHVDSCLKKTVSNYEGFDYYLCGGRSVVPALKQSLINLGAPLESIFFEKF